MERLECPIRAYYWGSRTAIAGIQGRPVPSPEPEAELWVGAHPAAPARLAGTTLPERIATDPVGTLGSGVLTRFGARLPYLMKLLAAEEPLSLQAHPDSEHAAAGYAAEQADGVPADAPHRRYVDPYHKPELLVAISRFRALCGLRDPAGSADLVAGLGVPALDPVVTALRAGDLAGAMTVLLSDRPPPVAQVGQSARRLGGPYEVVADLAAAFPADPGVVVALLLRQITLAPGQAIFVPAGNLHAYLSGVAVEVMAASDNVLRAGFTTKYVDRAELLRVLRFEALDEPVRDPVPVSPGVVTWPVPVDDFSLHRVTLTGGLRAATLAVPGPCAVLCMAGDVSVDDGVAAVTLGAGAAAFGGGGAGDGRDGSVAAALRLTGAGEAFVASVGWAGAVPGFSGNRLTSQSRPVIS